MSTDRFENASSDRLIVTIVQRILTHYRVPFFEQLRSHLQDIDISLNLVHGQPTALEAKKSDLGHLDWATPVKNRYLSLSENVHLVWQPLHPLLGTSDLIVVEQANRLILNYRLLRSRFRQDRKVALWGHGVSRDSHGLARWGLPLKRNLALRPDWWFAYTAETARVVEGFGFPPERVTVVQNAIDTVTLRRLQHALKPEEITAHRKHLGIEGENIGIYCGGLYEEKRLAFLIEASRHLRALVPDFHLLVLGAGPQEHLVEAAAQELNWLHHIGPQFGEEKVKWFSLADVLLMPGRVGLAVTDSFALGVPLVTTDIPYHSPEIEYLEHDKQGLILPAPSTPEEYAGHVASLLLDPARLNRLVSGCRQAAGTYTLDSMVERFSAGIKDALSVTPEAPQDI